MDATQQPSLTESHLAKKFDIAAATWRKWRARGRGPAFYRLGGKIRYALTDVEAWIQASRVQPGAPKGKPRRERKPQARVTGHGEAP